ncbi:hypothetical protein C8R47DRAFT_1084091 [Mycena vitilis]|nr:hypothetical protein C8R47DRAFT_1084091 [Mycena vitilis]
MPVNRAEKPTDGTLSTPSTGTLHSFFPTVDKKVTRRPLNASVPLPRKKPLNSGRTNPSPLLPGSAAAAADFQRRVRPRSKAVVYPPPAPDVAVAPGARLMRDEPLTVEDLWRAPGGGPPPVKAHVDDCCSICLQLVSHPVFCVCGHAHCYTCLRIWLEEQWICPERTCASIVTSAPFRVPAYESLLERLYGKWDTSQITYDWSGLTFPVMPALGATLRSHEAALDERLRMKMALRDAVNLITVPTLHALSLLLLAVLTCLASRVYTEFIPSASHRGGMAAERFVVVVDLVLDQATGLACVARMITVSFVRSRHRVIGALTFYKLNVSRRDKYSRVMSPTTVPLTTVHTISRINARMDALAVDPRGQPFPGFIKGFLFATGMTTAITVRVPIILADTPNEYSNMLYMPWLATDPVHLLTNLSYTDMNVAHADGESAFTVFAPHQDSPMGSRDLLHPVSQYFAGTQLPGVPPWRGNILVMRRELGSELMVDVRDSDLAHAVHCAIGVAGSSGEGGSPMVIAVA